MASKAMKSASVKLTDWKKPPTILSLKEDLQGAKTSHDAHASRVRHWNNLRDVSGSVKIKPVTGRSTVQPKLIRRQAEWRYSALSSPFLSNPALFQVEGTTFEDGDAAAQNQILINWQFRTKMNTVAFINQYVRIGVDEGSVIVRVGWSRVTRKKKVEVPVYQYMTPESEEQVTALQEAGMMFEANPNDYKNLAPELQAAVEYMIETGVPTVAVVVGTEEVVEDEVVENKPVLQILDPANAYIDPSCQGDLEKAKFMVISFETSKADLLKDGRYKNLDHVNWGGNTILGEPDHATKTPSDFNFSDELRKRVVAYEYWGFRDIDGSDTLKPIMAVWIGDTLIRMEENPFPDEKLPFVVVPYLPIKRQLLGEPDAEILEDNQSILGAVTRGMIDLLGRSANSQQGVAKNFLDATNRRKYDQGRDYEFNPGLGDPRLAVYMHSYPEIPNSAITMLSLQNSEAEALTGVKSFNGGLSGEAYGEVAAGIKGMLDAAAKREMDILQRLAQGMKEIGAKIVSMNAVFLSEEEVVRVTNEKFVKIRREDLKGNFDLKVDIATAEIDEAKAQDMGFMLQTMGPDMDPAMSRLILADIATLKRMPELAHSIKTYQPPEDPVKKKLQELELLKLEQEIEELKSIAELNRAKARKALSEADHTDLNYVEQETGTKHARDVEKMATQGQANADLAITHSLLKPRKPDESAPDVLAAVGFNRMAEMSK